MHFHSRDHSPTTKGRRFAVFYPKNFLSKLNKINAHSESMGLYRMFLHRTRVLFTGRWTSLNFGESKIRRLRYTRGHESSDGWFTLIGWLEIAKVWKLKSWKFPIKLLRFWWSLWLTTRLFTRFTAKRSHSKLFSNFFFRFSEKNSLSVDLGWRNETEPPTIQFVQFNFKFRKSWLKGPACACALCAESLANSERVYWLRSEKTFFKVKKSSIHYNTLYNFAHTHGQTLAFQHQKKNAAVQTCFICADSYACSLVYALDAMH